MPTGNGPRWADAARFACGTRVFAVERVTGIEPALSAWEADVLPLNYTRGRADWYSTQARSEV